MGQTDRDFVQMAESNPEKYCDSDVIVLASDTDLAADAQAHRLATDLQQSFMRSTGDRAFFRMHGRDDALPLGGNDGPFHDAPEGGQEVASKIDRGRAHVMNEQHLLLLLFLGMVRGQSHLQCGPSHPATGGAHGATPALPTMDRSVMRLMEK